MADSEKTYLGDGVYAQNVGGRVVLTVEDGIETHETIILDERTLATFLNWVKRQGG
jgi:hypothetical protein